MRGPSRPVGVLIALLWIPVALPSTGPRAAKPIVLPEGPLLALTRSDGALAVAAEEGNRTIRLATPRGAAVWDHSWSPDGSRLVFTRCGNTACVVYLIDANGDNERRVTTGAGAVWMPGRKQILVGRADRPGYWLVNVESGRRRSYTAPGLAAAPGTARLSPDGRWLLHLAKPYGKLVCSSPVPHHRRARNWLMVTDLATGRTRRLTNQRGWYILGTAPVFPGRSSFTLHAPAVSSGVQREHRRRRPSERDIKPVASGARDGGAWSPDGTRLAFNGTSCVLKVISLGDPPSVRRLPFRGCRPTWRPMRAEQSS